MYFKTIEESNRGINFDAMDELTKQKFMKKCIEKGFIADFDNDIMVHPKLGALVGNIPIKKASEPQEELIKKYSELIQDGCHLVLGIPYNATLSKDSSMSLYGVYCPNYLDVLDKTKSKEKSL